MAKHMTQDDRKTLEARYNAGQSVAGIARAMQFNYSTIYKELKDRGFSTFGRETTISVCPPLTITEAELAEVMPILDEVLTLVDEQYM